MEERVGESEGLVLKCDVGDQSEVDRESERGTVDLCRQFKVGSKSGRVDNQQPSGAEREQVEVFGADDQVCCHKKCQPVVVDLHREDTTHPEQLGVRTWSVQGKDTGHLDNERVGR